MAKVKLTPAQWRHLERIALGPGDSNMPAAGWLKTKPEQALIDRGLIRVWEQTSLLGGSGPMGRLSVTWRYAEVTHAGWFVLGS